ncbi:dihydrofolate reductase [Streptomyces sp. NP160]|uniref:dihydrofolate reductase family protein n=1 Tax=Streptomyces sp. NP160 TaxID=2586637 RepID=UPI00111A0950|nr:dihydrofolate reductase family protein [Streptomyces sp. NP160]TNM64403.1 dihydrofolate reductase [Streptomyces sp. NP160]
MRTLAITQNTTVDGAVEVLGDWFDAQGQGGSDQSDLLEVLQRDSAASDALLVGRRTFEDLRGYWPHQDGDTTGVSAHLDAVSKHVVTSTMNDPGWQNTTVISGDVIAEVRALKEGPGRDVVVTGSIRLCHTLIAAGLVDEYRLFTYPVVQGGGRRLFPDGHQLPALRLLESRAFRSGTTYTRYGVAPGDPPGSAAGGGAP